MHTVFQRPFTHLKGALVAASLLTASLLLMACGTAGHAQETAAPGRPALSSVHSWVYQLQGYQGGLSQIAASAAGLAVIDPSSSGGADGRWTPAEIARAGTHKLLLAYLSIGEAEDYREYWQNWRVGSPAFVVREDPDWPGNYYVRYWDPAWQQVLYSALDAIIAQGFDGAYLDLVDSYEQFPQQPQARAQMIALVCGLQQHARARRPGFLIVPQNASELIHVPGYADCIDATGQEETFVSATNRPTSAAERARRLTDYAAFLRAGKPVFTVDYATSPALVRESQRLARQAGLIPYVTDVDLDTLIDQGR